MKVAIFGASGFLGKNLVKSLKLKTDVQEVSLRDTSWRNNINIESNVFINLVGKVHDHKGTATEKDYYYANVELAQNIFEIFNKSNADLFIHISSIAALEEFESTKPLVESDECHPFSVYGQSKREAEQWLIKQSLSGNKKLIIIRPPMVHGRGDKGNLGLLYNIVSKGIPYPLASFDNERSFLSIDNFTFYLEKIIERYDSLENGIYHISDNETVSTIKIIEIINAALDKRVPTISVPKCLIKNLARIGDFIPFPLNSNRLRKMTSDLVVSNKKINSILHIVQLPESAVDGLKKTILSFK